MKHRLAGALLAGASLSWGQDLDQIRPLELERPASSGLALPDPVRKKIPL